MQFVEPQDRLNIFLPSTIVEEKLWSRLTQGGPEWPIEQYENVRTAAGELETADIPFQQPDTESITKVLTALAGDTRMQTALRALGIDSAVAEGQYMSFADLEGMGPPLDRPFAIPEIGLVSVPGRPVAEAADAAKAAASRVKVDIEARPAVPMYATSTALTEELSGTAGMTFPAENFFDSDEVNERWLEAELEAGLVTEQISWGVARVNAPGAWTRGYLGQGIRVAVVDTGTGPHVDLPAPVASATFVPGSHSANDENGHGTHVAGTIMARRNGFGVVGVAPRAQLLRAKVLNRFGLGSDTSVAAGIVWAANQGAQIINLSVSGPFSLAIQRALAYARSRRVVICAAAGNSSTPFRPAPVSYPARDPLCIAVAATDQVNQRAVFSACGRELDLAAPGVFVLSTHLGNTYRMLSATSIATPHVTGVCALLLSRSPGLDPARLQRHLERTAVPLGPITQFGRGLVQADRAVSEPILGLESSTTTIEHILAERVPALVTAGKSLVTAGDGVY